MADPPVLLDALLLVDGPVDLKVRRSANGRGHFSLGPITASLADLDAVIRLGTELVHGAERAQRACVAQERLDGVDAA